ncbi:MAG TPA: CmcJ/NvfI family oxidoreductase [Steroidobacteraceae bacterium]|nr:CmcJ/NvfI family oxidoreductase [Steroidobacteraceae bacterium]
MAAQPESTRRAHEDGARCVDAKIAYLVSDCGVNRRFVAAGVEINTGRYQPFEVKVRDARPFQDGIRLETHGFQLFRMPSRVTDFMDRSAVDSGYAEEVAQGVRSATGASRVVPMAWMVRTSGDLTKFERRTVGYSHQGGVQPPAAEAHVDFAPAQAHRLAQNLYEKHAPGGPGYQRFICGSFWRAFSEPPQDWPLAVCDGRSLDPEEGVTNTLVIVDSLPTPEAAVAAIPGEELLPAASVFRFNPRHRWWYFPRMTREEVLLIKFYDSDRSVAWRAPHTAFQDPSFTDARVRFSIELRWVAFFEQLSRTGP